MYKLKTKTSDRVFMLKRLKEAYGPMSKQKRQSVQIGRNMKKNIQFLLFVIVKELSETQEILYTYEF